MAVKFFGQFLVEKGAVSRAQLLEAIDLQEQVNLKFGAMALSMGLLSTADIERVHDAQRGEDLRFGDMAVKLGLLSGEQMQQVLTRQKNCHIYIGEALVRVGALSEAQLPALLEAFRLDQAPYLTERLALPQGLLEPGLWELSVDLTGKMLIRVAELVVRAAPVEEASALSSRAATVALGFSGSLAGRYLLSVDDNVRRRMACALLKEQDVSAEPLEVLNDTVMEFANVVCGNIAAKAAQLGLSLEISPPELVAEGPASVAVPAGVRALRVPFVSAEGDGVDLLLWFAAS